ncbi:MAG: 3-oxoacyl-ACP synthase [Saprospiraceae bacterium]|nr:GreA/GreB family elongation factor [Bacteroidia bacterium]NNE16418.1 3-oxoacyl-ACP synthase [Saprospiraceae bacterium]NNL92610.1 3-oxoacyl-ACP synthase [Saprospiraceae bacterium]
MKDIKSKLFVAINEILDQRIDKYRKTIERTIDSKSNETKSSAGDKFETGRAMIQREQEMNEGFLNQNLTLKNQLAQINLNPNETVQVGSLVITENAQYFISIGIGKVQVNNQIVFVVSPQSPIAKALIGKPKGDVFSFNDINFEIMEIF